MQRTALSILLFPKDKRSSIVKVVSVLHIAFNVARTEIRRGGLESDVTRKEDEEEKKRESESETLKG